MLGSTLIIFLFKKYIDFLFFCAKQWLHQTKRVVFVTLFNFWDRVSCSQSWPGTSNSPASTSSLLGLQECHHTWLVSLPYIYSFFFSCTSLSLHCEDGAVAVETWKNKVRHRDQGGLCQIQQKLSLFLMGKTPSDSLRALGLHIARDRGVPPTLHSDTFLWGKLSV